MDIVKKIYTAIFHLLSLVLEQLIVPKAQLLFLRTTCSRFRPKQKSLFPNPRHTHKRVKQKGKTKAAAAASSGGHFRVVLIPTTVAECDVGTITALPSLFLFISFLDGHNERGALLEPSQGRHRHGRMLVLARRLDGHRGHQDFRRRRRGRGRLRVTTVGRLLADFV